MQNELARLVRPSQEEIGEYVKKQEPVIISGLFENYPIDEIRSLEAALKEFGDLKIWVQPEYISAVTGNTDAAALMPFAQYWDYVRANPASRLVCTEHDIPARMMSMFRTPSACLAQPENAEILDLPKKIGDFDLFLNMFMAHSGSVANLHYDGDHREVLLHQVFGRKEVILFKPAAGVHLNTFRFNVFSSGHLLNEMAVEEKESLLRNTGGLHGVMYPGETVFIPKLYWHYLKYLDHGLSFNIRFGRRALNRFLSIDNFHRDYYIQNFCCKLSDPVVSSTVRINTLPKIISKYLEHLPLPTKVREMRSIFRELCQEYCPEAEVERYCGPSDEERHLKMILTDIQSSPRYMPPAIVKRIRQNGPQSLAQQNLLRESVNQRSYPAQGLKQILSNMFGKSDLRDLSKIEAARFISYVSSHSGSI